MEASSNTIELQDWQSTLTFLPHDALPDSHSITSYAKSTAETGTDFYDRSVTSSRYAIAGVACSSIVSCCCIVTGTVIISTRGIAGKIQLIRPSSSNPNLQAEMLTLILTLIVTLCTESIGLMHGISLRSALASEARLIFSTNLRLFTAAHGWRNPNGTLLNGLMAILLILSYSSVSIALFPPDIMGVPLLVLGIALLLQVAIASCMRNVVDLNIAEGPAMPSETQPSAWQAHPHIRTVVIFLWGLVVACTGLVAFLRYKQNSWNASTSWTLIPPPEDGIYGISYYLPMDISVQAWILAIGNITVAQGPLTLGVHCSELIVNTIQNEGQWRCATARKGLRTMVNPLKAFLINPLDLVLFVMKPALHWMFGLSFSVQFVTDDNHIIVGFFTKMLVIQTFNLCIAQFIFACFFTLIALRRPRGPQPATYGHLQTLANLVDEWSPVMWWGHKKDEIPYCHAGTSDHQLPDVKMDCVYAGSGATRVPSTHPGRSTRS
ncbi:hypothetical protein DFH29DRAFT_1047004 [Suillus ampliporus]|nr:hypothetical protein DFH29DRAFT_1047004 [Suillus ampliporus]